MFISVMARLIASQACLRSPMLSVDRFRRRFLQPSLPVLARQFGGVVGMPRISTGKRDRASPVAVDLIVRLRLPRGQAPGSAGHQAGSYGWAAVAAPSWIGRSAMRARLMPSDRLRFSPAAGFQGRDALRRRGRARRRVVRCRLRPDLRPDRAERLRQDHAVQLHQRLLSLRRRRHPVRGPLAQEPGAPPHGRPGHRPHLPERRAVPPHERARQHPGRRASSRPLRLHRQCAAPAGGAAGGRGGVRAAARSARSARSARRRRRAGRQPAVRHAEARRAGARADRRAEAADARRTGGRAQPQRGRRPGAVAAAHPRAFRSQHPAGRASHEPGDARVATRWWRWSSA